MLKGIVLVLLCSIAAANAEYGMPSFRRSRISTGMGLDAGGIGIKYAFNPLRHAGIFLGLGTNFVGTGYNVGVELNAVAPDSMSGRRLSAHIMYGYNTVTMVVGLEEEYNKIFYGITPGVGIGFRFGQRKSHGPDIKLNVPIRGTEVQEHIDEMKNDSRVTMAVDLLPIAFSFLYSWEL